jgi:ribonuclease BN (tRNA processing enzyme)
VRLTIVGSAGSVPGPDSAASCYLLEAEADGRRWSLALDMGSGAMGPLQRYVNPSRLDAVLISHGHPDHCADLGGLSVLRRYGPDKDAGLPRIALFGPPGLDRRIMEVTGDPRGDDLTIFDYTALQHGARISLGPFDITAVKAFHPVPALAYRIEGPSAGRGRASIVFTGDTDRCTEVDQLSRDCDLLLGEAGWAHRLENPPGIHMNGNELGELAAASGARTLVVTHIASWVDPAETMQQVRSRVPAAALAEPGQFYDV